MTAEDERAIESYERRMERENELNRKYIKTEEEKMVKINSLEIESVKRIKAVRLEPKESGLTIIGGDNGEGKTSVLDAIAWALGGEKYHPTNAKNEQSVNSPFLHVELSNGVVVERKGENSALTVRDKSGVRNGQTLLNAFISEFALNLPKFLESSGKEKAQTLLNIIGIGDQLLAMDQEEKRIYDERHAVGRLAEQKKKFAQELPHYDGVPSVPVSAIDLIRRQQDILAQNGENKRKRDRAKELERERADLESRIADLQTQLATVVRDLGIAQVSLQGLEDQSTEQLEKDIADIDNLNVRIRANLDRERATEEADKLFDTYQELSDKIEKIRSDRLSLLNGADLPLPDLSVQNGELLYRGKAWDCMSGAERLKVAVAIVRRLQPECGFVLVDKLEQMDIRTLREFSAWCESIGLQVIATRVSTGEECTIIIEDGYVANNSDVNN